VSRALRSCCSGADFHARSGRGLVFLVASLVGASLGGVTLGAQASRGNVQDSGPPAATSLSNGRYCALVIGNNHYGYMGRLETAANDANAVANCCRNAMVLRLGFCLMCPETISLLMCIARGGTPHLKPTGKTPSQKGGYTSAVCRGQALDMLEAHASG
jgi:hypothetical protein